MPNREGPHFEPHFEPTHFEPHFEPVHPEPFPPHNEPVHVEPHVGYDPRPLFFPIEPRPDPIIIEPTPVVVVQTVNVRTLAPMVFAWRDGEGGPAQPAGVYALPPDVANALVAQGLAQLV